MVLVVAVFAAAIKEFIIVVYGEHKFSFLT